MHEYAIATDIVRTIKDNYSEEFEFLTTINISIGKFSGIVADSLDFGIETVLKEDGLENINIEISESKAEVVCECKFKYELRDMFDICPQCGSIKREMLSGDEVTIDTIEFNKSEKEGNI